MEIERVSTFEDVELMAGRYEGSLIETANPKKRPGTRWSAYRQLRPDLANPSFKTGICIDITYRRSNEYEVDCTVIHIATATHTKITQELYTEETYASAINRVLWLISLYNKAFRGR